MDYPKSRMENRSQDVHHSSSNPKMYINPHFNQAKTVQPSLGTPHFNPNFYSKLYEPQKSDAGISAASKIHVNPKFVNVNKLQNDLVKVSQPNAWPTPVTSFSQNKHHSSYVSNYIPVTQNDLTSSSISHPTSSKYKFVNVNTLQNTAIQSSQAGSLHNHNSTIPTSAISCTVTSSTFNSTKSKYTLVRNQNNYDNLLNKPTPRTTVRVGRYKTVPLQNIVPPTVPVANANSMVSKNRAIDLQWNQHKNTINRKIDRRKPKVISRCVQVPTVISKLNSFNKSITIRSKKFSVGNRSLKLVGPKSDHLNTTGKLKVRVNGRTYVQTSRDVFVRKSFVMRNRESLKKNNVPCPLFRKFGKCPKKEKGKCCLLHDKKHVSVCRKFLKGQCQNDHCLLSHQATAEKMPTCSFYLQGCCYRENCPYLHVKLSDSADVCTDFLKGYCERGDQCAKRHVYLCPEFAKNGNCSLSKCPNPHKQTGTFADKNMLPSKYSKPKIISTVPTEEIENGVGLKKNEATSSKTESRRYYVRGKSQEAAEGGAEGGEGGGEVHTTRERLGALPSFIKL